ncbi:hypothetical protein FIBSPDRAFT_871511 [Athelia psychrophila]|uniref:Uncharacterized protein n=1 Tax=Athelia psychrophila TaxID=1759441 RepID=A0A166A8M2_9AGAM|nr:hypothetical protein FIBSPDRAFT_871511 [Fibularhizoctonia sp. CBS 109695]
MVVYTLSHFFGPILGPPVGGFINRNMAGARRGPVQITWVFVELLLLLAVSGLLWRAVPSFPPTRPRKIRSHPPQIKIRPPARVHRRRGVLCPA